MSPTDCVVCLEAMVGQIYLCEVGHSVCGECKTKMGGLSCPMCRVRLTNRRNHNLEKLIKEMKKMEKKLTDLGIMECPFSKYGCNSRMEAQSMVEHKKDCPNRIVHCVFADKGCTKIYTISDLALMESHERSCQFRKVLCVNGCGECIPITEVKNHDSSCLYGKYPCRFRKEGCFETMRIFELGNHETQCKYRNINCIFLEDGCRKVGKLEEIEEHENICPFRRTICRYRTNGCEAELARHERLRHESKCEFRTVQCYFVQEGCLEAGNADYIWQHAISCSYRTVLCTFKQEGCGAVMTIPEMKKHEVDCAFRSTNCIFSSNGCTEKVMIRNIEEHEKQCQFLHTRVYLETFSDTYMRCGDCKRLLNSEVFSVNSKLRPYCEKCSQKYLEFGITRNKTCEDLIEIIRKQFFLPCKFQYNGCEEFFILENKEAHDSECEFRDIRCKIPYCMWKDKIGLLTNHMSSHINNNNMRVMTFREGKYRSDNLTENIQFLDLRIIMLKADKELFACTLQRKDDVIYWIVQLIGKTSVANQYTYKIKIVRENRKLTRMKVCESDSQDPEELIATQKCVSFSAKTLNGQNFVDIDTLNFVIEINRVSP